MCCYVWNQSLSTRLSISLFLYFSDFWVSAVPRVRFNIAKYEYKLGWHLKGAAGCWHAGWQCKVNNIHSSFPLSIKNELNRQAKPINCGALNKKLPPESGAKLTVCVEPLGEVGGHAGDRHHGVRQAGRETWGAVPVRGADGLEIFRYFSVILYFCEHCFQKWGRRQPSSFLKSKMWVMIFFLIALKADVMGIQWN